MDELTERIEEQMIESGEQSMRIAICDDEETDMIRFKKALLKELSSTKYAKVTIELFTVGDELIRENSCNSFDLVFLDLEMPGIDGEEIARYYNMESEDTVLVFVSYHEELVFKTLYTYPAAFIRKMNLEEDLQQSLPRILERYEENKEIIQLDTIDGSMRFTISKIRYFKSENRRVIVNLAGDREVMIKYSIRALNDLLESKGFYRTDQSYLVNRRYISHIEKDTIVLVGGNKSLPLSRRREKQIKKDFLDFVMG